MSARTTPRRLARTLIASAALVAGVLAAAPSASADEATDAPVTMADEVTIDGGAFTQVDVLANDTDPNGDELAICRIDVPDNAPLFVENFDGSLFIGSARNKTATYEITYYACDFDYLTPATVTVHVVKFPELKAATIAGKPGRVKFTNPGDKKVVVLFGNRNNEKPDGRVGVPAHKSAVISTKRHQLYYVGFVRSSGALAGEGTVRNIAQPKKPVAQRPMPLSYSKQELKEWSSAR